MVPNFWGGGNPRAPYPLYETLEVLAIVIEILSKIFDNTHKE